LAIRRSPALRRVCWRRGEKSRLTVYKKRFSEKKRELVGKKVRKEKKKVRELGSKNFEVNSRGAKRTYPKRQNASSDQSRSE